MGWLEAYKPGMAMIVVQCTYAVMTVVTREAMLRGMSSTVFLVYRQTIATLVIAPIAIFSSYRKENNTTSIGWKSFWLIFVTALIGVAINQNLYFEGVLLASSSMGAAMNNIIPAITFVIAFTLGLEKINIRELRSIAKIVGTTLCIFGAFVMTLLRGPELFDATLPPMLQSILGTSTKNWYIGCACILASNCFWSTWLILQAKITEVCPDHLSSSAWMCFLAAVQSAVIALCIERDFDKWVLDSPIDIASVSIAGIGGSALAFFLQAYCISKRGPVFSALFNPVCTIVVTILAAIFLKEEIYVGSFVGAIVIIIGLYIVLWGKAKDVVQKDGSKPAGDEDDVQVLVDETREQHREPLLST